MKEKKPGEYPCALASNCWENSFLMESKIFRYDARFERGVLPMGLWSMSLMPFIFSAPSRALYGSGC